MYHVYLLRSVKNPQMTYVGFTAKDIRERMNEHNRGLTRTTAPHIPWNIEVVVSFKDMSKAQEFEAYLKNGSGYAFAKRHFWSDHANLVEQEANSAEFKKQVVLEENRSAKLSALRSSAEQSA